MLVPYVVPALRRLPCTQRRLVSTLPNRPDIYIHPQPNSSIHILSLSPSPTALPFGTTTTLPPTPSSFTEEPFFLPLLHRILATHAAHDPVVTSDAQSYTSQINTPLQQTFERGRRKKAEKVASEPVGGYLHVYDMRAVPSFGRISEVEDIFGSLRVDEEGRLVEGSWEPNGMYRLVTGMGGVMRLSEFLRGKVREGVEREGK